MKWIIVLASIVLCLELTEGFGVIQRNGKLKIGVYLSSMCKDSQNFVTNDLFPAYQDLKDFVDIEFIPWGKAKLDQNGKIHCQFGDRDCDGNKLQSCVLHLLENDKDKQMDYMLCEYSTMASTNGNYQCAYESGISPILANQCFESSLGRGLQRYAHAKTSDKVISFVPTIEYNGVYDENVSMAAFKNFKSVSCYYLNEIYPGLCRVL